MTRLIIECSEHDANVFRDGYDAEPAPPKDWRPVCYSGILGEPCGGRFIQIGARRLRPECEQCPYHNLE